MIESIKSTLSFDFKQGNIFTQRKYFYYLNNKNSWKKQESSQAQSLLISFFNIGTYCSKNLI